MSLNKIVDDLIKDLQKPEIERKLKEVERKLDRNENWNVPTQFKRKRKRKLAKRIVRKKKLTQRPGTIYPTMSPINLETLTVNVDGNGSLIAVDPWLGDLGTIDVPAKTSPKTLVRELHSGVDVRVINTNDFPVKVIVQKG